MLHLVKSENLAIVGSTWIKISSLPFSSSGLGCSKLTTSLVNVSLKFQMLISQLCQYFLLKKCEKLAKAFLNFSIKNINVFGYKLVKHLTVDLLTSLLS